MPEGTGKLNIAIFGHKRIPSREGGIEVVVEKLATWMVEQGHQVTCYDRSGHHVSGAEFDTHEGKLYKGVKLKQVWTINRRGLAAMTSSVSSAFLAAVGSYDVVHIHAEGPAFMCWLPKLAGKRVIVTVHGLDHQRAKWGRFAQKYIMMGERSAARYADEIIVLSRGVQDYFEKTYRRDTRFIPNGVERPMPVEAKEIKERWGLEKDNYVLFLGRLVPEKGIQYLIEAWKGIRTDKRLVVAGGSSDSESFMNGLREMADGNVIFTGFIQGRILEELFSNAYVYCLPSDLEGMPLSLLEAMSYGNCCLVSDISECTEVVESHGVVFRHGNAAALRKALQSLLDAPELVKRYRGTAAEYICRKYSWDDMAEKTLELYLGKTGCAVEECGLMK